VCCCPGDKHAVEDEISETELHRGSHAWGGVWCGVVWCEWCGVCEGCGVGCVRGDVFCEMRCVRCVGKGVV
jgi:hypothetical protein